MDVPSDHVDAVASRVWFRFLRLQGRIRVTMSARLKGAGLSIPQCDVLTTLMEHDGVSQQELAAHLYVTKGNISGLVDRLETAGLVERRAISGDRRSNALCLTSAGREAARTGIAIQERFVADTFGQMSAAELDTLERSLLQVRDRVRETARVLPSNAPQPERRR